MSKERQLLILEPTSEYFEGKSEGKLLNELIKILECEDKVEYKNPLGKGVFLDALNNVEQEYVHISTHGGTGVRGTNLQIQRRKNGRFMKVSIRDLETLWKNNDPPKLVVLSACNAGHKDMRDAFTMAGCRSIIAPIRDTNWDYAATFSALFYRSLLGDACSPWVAYKRASKGMNAAYPHSIGRWKFYKDGEAMPIG